MSKFQNLQSVTDAMYLRAQQSLRSVVLREGQLRAELQKLDTHARTVRVEQPVTLETMRGLGADLLWEGWLERTRAQLNLELAKVLAQKEQHIGKVRKSFGKKTVSEMLLRTDLATRAKAKRNGELTQAIDQALRTQR